MKNIIFLTFLNVWSMGKNKGASSFFKTIDTYVKNGWNVYLVKPENTGAPQLEGVNYITYKPKFTNLKKIRKIGYIFKRLYVWHGNNKLYKLAKKQLGLLDNKAVIYAYEVYGVKPGKKLSDKLGLPFVTRFQGTIIAPIKDSFINRLRFYPHFDAISTDADITIMTDDGTQGNKVLKRLNNNSKEIYFWRNGLNNDVFEQLSFDKAADLKKTLNIDENDKVLLTVSRLAYWKKVDRAIHALAEVCKQKNNVKLVIVGDGDEKQRLMSLSKELGLSSKVIFVGAVAQSKVKEYMAMADIFLSLYDLSNVGNPLLEAMSYGLPIITLNVGDTNTLITNNENGILLQPNDLNSLPGHIINLMSNTSKADGLGNNAKEFAAKTFITWDKRMQNEIDVVERIYSTSIEKGE